MPEYEIEQYELYIQKNIVEAEDETEAIAKLMGGEGDPVNEGLEFIAVAEDVGMPAENYPDLVRGLEEEWDCRLDVVISGIRSIRKLETEAELS